MEPHAFSNGGGCCNMADFYHVTFAFRRADFYNEIPSIGCQEKNPSLQRSGSIVFLYYLHWKTFGRTVHPTETTTVSNTRSATRSRLEQLHVQNERAALPQQYSSTPIVMGLRVFGVEAHPKLSKPLCQEHDSATAPLLMQRRTQKFFNVLISFVIFFFMREKIMWRAKSRQRTAFQLATFPSAFSVCRLIVGRLAIATTQPPTSAEDHRLLLGAFAEATYYFYFPSRVNYLSNFRFI